MTSKRNDWGEGTKGQTGNGGAQPPPGLTKVNTDFFAPLGNVIALAAGGAFTCALTQGGSVQCWGDNNLGELGSRGVVQSVFPLQVAGLGVSTAVTAGFFHACAFGGGAVRCWGGRHYVRPIARKMRDAAEETARQREARVETWHTSPNGRRELREEARELRGWQLWTPAPSTANVDTELTSLRLDVESERREDPAFEEAHAELARRIGKIKARFAAIEEWIRLSLGFFGESNLAFVNAATNGGAEVAGSSLVVRDGNAIIIHNHQRARSDTADMSQWTRSSPASSFRTIKELGNEATQIALQLYAIGPVTTAQEHQSHDPMGTATVIAPHLAITCKHVVEHYFRSYRLRDGANEANFLLSATMVMPSGRVAFDLVVKAVTLSPHTDVAFLHLGGLPEPLPFTEWALPVVTLFPPRIGSVVHAVGYHSARAEVDHARREIHVHREVAISDGMVVDVHEERRDARLNFPCFQTDARFDGGMSGGPVFNDAGALCGIISSNLPPSADGEPHVSYVATLWLITHRKFDA